MAVIACSLIVAGVLGRHCNAPNKAGKSQRPPNKNQQKSPASLPGFG
jgi:hypothetical protein